MNPTTPEVTEWFPMDTPPVRTGLYEVERRMGNGIAIDIRRYWWDGGRFVMPESHDFGAPLIDSQDVWRGLRSPV